MESKMAKLEGKAELFFFPLFYFALRVYGDKEWIQRIWRLGATLSPPHISQPCFGFVFCQVFRRLSFPMKIVPESSYTSTGKTILWGFHSPFFAAQGK
jgi:hypothetical protein